jgi:hypothetical protein
MGGDRSHFSEIDVWKIIHGSQQVEVSHLFAFLLLICLCLLVGPHLPNGFYLFIQVYCPYATLGYERPNPHL